MDACPCSYILIWPESESGCASRQPVAREVFLREFWACFRRLEDAADDMVGKAAYFRFLTLLGAILREACLMPCC